jgi:hypothetical protein
MTDGGDLLGSAARRAVQLFESGFAADRRPEERARQSFIAALHEHPDVGATLPEPGHTAEFRPDLPEWPHASPAAKLGGFDLAIRTTGKTDWQYLAEFKWDSLWMALWDLAHGSRLQGVEETFLIAVQLEREWAKPVECAELFDDHTIATRELLARYEARWRNMDGAGKSRPLTLPGALTLRRVADIPIATKYGASRLRVSSVTPTSAEWLLLDSACWPLPVEQSEIIEWPYPEPGPGMVAPDGQDFMWPPHERAPISNERLTESDLPGPDDDWGRIEWFAITFDGYEEWGSFENLAPLANLTQAYFDRVGEMPMLELRELRGCLFFEHRRHHHLGHAPDATSTKYIRALVEEIRRLVVAQDFD